MILDILGKIIKGLLDLLIMLISGLTGVKKTKVISLDTRNLIEGEWVTINSELRNHSPAVLKHALIKADKSLDNLLKEIVTGNTMGERMIAAKERFSPTTYSSIWSGHKVRNAMVHDAGFDPSYVVLVKAIEDLRKGVRELGIRA